MPRIRTGFSFRSAVGKLEDVMARLIECGYAAAPITDRASTFGWARWAKLAEKNNLKPVFGVELAVTESIHAKKPIVDYWTFIAKGDITPINDLLNLATQQFRYEPLLTYEQAQKADCFKIVGSRARLELVTPHDDLFVGLGPGVSKGYFKKAIEMGLKPIAVSDNKFVNPGEEGLYEVVCGRGANTQTYDQFIQTGDEWAKSILPLAAFRCEYGTSFDASFLNKDEVMIRSTATLKQADLLAPERPATLLKMCEDGAQKLNIDLTDATYKDRLTHELKLIHEKQYEDYFYIVEDICRFARARMIVGPARGSSCGSLVCYLLGITTIDPIPYGLIFERFIDVNRDDLPDIDIDFSDQQRSMVLDYVSDKYGAEHVARLGTVAMYQPKSALNETSKALRIPKWKCDAVAESLIDRAAGDERANNVLEDTLATTDAGKALIKEFPEMAIAAQMEGHPRHAGQHAAGIVVSKTPVSEIVAVDHRTGATMCDKKDAEALNLLKIDALGLTQLSVFEDCLEMAALDRSILDDLPLYDPEAFEILNSGKFSGIFQFAGRALQGITEQLEVEEFNDLVTVTALARPGPLNSGSAQEWVKRKNDPNKVVYLHDVFKPHLQETLGIMVYQEQVMKIAREVGGLSWGDVTALRKAISKSLGKEAMAEYGEPFKKGAMEKGVSEEDADLFWSQLLEHGAYGFNKSHSVAYGLVSYQCCWLKAHYPFEFAAATLTHETDPEKQIRLLREMALEGYDYVPVDVKYSTDKWAVGEKYGKRILVGPLTNVKGVGPKIVASVLGAKARGEKIPDRAMKLLTNPVTPIDSLWPIRDAFRRLMPDPSERNIHSKPMAMKDVVLKNFDYDALVFCTFSHINQKDGDKVSLNLQMTDDTDTIFGKVGWRDFKRLGAEIVERGRVGKALYAVKGEVGTWCSFRMMMIKDVRYIGEM